MVNWQNIGKALMQVGQSTMQMGVMFGMMRNQGCRHGCNLGGMMSMQGSIMPGFGGGNWRCNYANPYIQQGIAHNAAGAAFNQGCIDMMRILAHTRTNQTQQLMFGNLNFTLQPSKHKLADKVGEDVDPEKGSSIDKDLKPLFDDESAEVTISQYKDKEEYKKDLTDLGKSYVRFMDTYNDADGDGYVSEEEWVKAQSEGVELSDHDLTITKNMFRTLDQNQDGQLDYKEMSSMFYAMDYNYSAKSGETTLNGKIAGADYKEMLTQAEDDKLNDQLSKNLVDGYRNLFGEDK